MTNESSAGIGDIFGFVSETLLWRTVWGLLTAQPNMLITFFFLDLNEHAAHLLKAELH